jgi:hypothetical protein
MALAFYPLVAWRAWLMPPAAEGKAWCDGRRREAAPRRPPRGGPPSLRVIGSDVGLVRLGQRARGAVIVVQKELCAQEVCSERAAPGYGVYRHRNRGMNVEGLLVAVVLSGFFGFGRG